MKTDIAAWLNDLRLRLLSVSETPALDAQVLLAHTLQVSKAWLAAHRDEEIRNDILPALEKKIQQLENGIPLPYVIGEWEFFGLPFYVNPAVLIPRPETELLVEQAIIWLECHPGDKKALDAGTGTGCIPISISKNSPGCKWLATDVSPAALEVAAQNISRHQLENRISLLEADVLDGVQGYFDLVCSNPPYIPTGVYQTLAVSWHEPRLALDGGPDGLNLVRKLLEQAASLINSPGLILCEIEETQGDQVLAIAKAFYPQASVQVLQDIAGKPRLLQIEVN